MKRYIHFFVLATLVIVFISAITLIPRQIEQKKREVQTKTEQRIKDLKTSEEIKKSVENSEDIKISNSEWLQRQKKLYQITEEEVDVVLKELKERFPDKEERIKALSFLRLGTPYQLGCLGEESGRDKDPIFRLDVTDCTAFLLTNVALLYSQDLKEAREIMKLLNYRSVEDIIFENRLHFTSERNIVSPYFYDITQEIAGKDKVVVKKVILNKVNPESGERLIDINWEKEVILRYIPNKYITQEFLSSFPKVLGIAFVREGDAKIGLDVAHEGFLFDGDTLIHASSVRKEVVEENFLDYYFDDSGKAKFDGIVLFTVTGE